MKRFYICIVLFALTIASCQLCMHQLYTVKETLLEELEQLTQAAQELPAEDVYQLAVQFQDSWEQKEHRIMSFVRHGDLDTMTISVARLPQLILQGDIGEFHSEADVVRTLISHIWDSERIALRNIL